MLNAQIKIQSIAYEKSFRVVFPVFQNKWESTDGASLVIRFLKKLGDASMPVALGILNRMPEKEKNEFLVTVTGMYQEQLLAALHHTLEQDEYGKNIGIGSVCLSQDRQGRVIVTAEGIKVNYHGLAQEEKVKNKIRGAAEKFARKVTDNQYFQNMAADGMETAVNTVTAILPNRIERKILDFLKKEENKKKLLEFIRQALEGQGIFLELADVEFSLSESADRKRETGCQEEKNLVFSEALQEALLDSVASYVKDSLQEQKAG